MSKHFFDSRAYQSVSELNINSMKNKNFSLYQALPEAPDFVSDFTQGKFFQNKSVLITDESLHTAKYIQCNHQKCIKLLVIDIDGSWKEAYDKAIKYNLLPTYIIKNRNNDKAHFVFELSEKVFLNNELTSNKGINFLLNATRYGLTYMLGGDMAYVNKFFKNPWNTQLYATYTTKSSPRTIQDLRKKIPSEIIKQLLHLKNTNKRVPLENIKEGGRNNGLRHLMNIEANNIKYKFPTISSEEFQENLFDLTTQHNSRFETPLPASEVRALAKSTHKYWLAKEGKASLSTRTRNIDCNLPLGEKQKNSAYGTHRIVAQKTLESLRLAFTFYMEQAVKPSQNGFTAFSGANRGTVRKYWDNLLNDTPLETKMTMPSAVREIKNTKVLLPSKCHKILDYLRKENITKFTTNSDIARAVGVDRATVTKYLSQIHEQIYLNNKV